MLEAERGWVRDGAHSVADRMGQEIDRMGQRATLDMEGLQFMPEGPQSAGYMEKSIYFQAGQNVELLLAWGSYSEGNVCELSVNKSSAPGSPTELLYRYAYNTRTDYHFHHPQSTSPGRMITHIETESGDNGVNITSTSLWFFLLQIEKCLYLD